MTRHAFITRIKPEYLDAYIDVHKKVWPELLDRYRQAGIRNLSCFMLADQLFLYLESDDYEAAEKTLTTDPIDMKWQQLVAPMQDENGFKKLTEIFHLD